MHHATCRGGTKILYAWAKDAPPTILPEDVGFKLSSDDGYLVLQVHYAHPLDDKDDTGLRLDYVTEKPKKGLAGVFLLFRTQLMIPPGKTAVHGDMNCKIGEQGMTVFAYRTHAHSLGSVITGYRVRKGEFKVCKKGMISHAQLWPFRKLLAGIRKGRRPSIR